MRTALGCALVLALAAPARGAPGALDRAGFAAGLATVKKPVDACGQRATKGGWVKVSVVVAPDGTVTSVEQEASDESLGSCVAEALQHATFRRTENGGTFAHPFVFPEPRPKPSTVRNSAAVEAALPPLRPALETCAMKQAFIGSVLVTLDVRADGGVNTVTIADSAVPKLADCLRTPLKRVKLAAGAAGKASHLLRLGGNNGGRTRTRASIDAALTAQRAPLVTCATKAGFKGQLPVKLGIRAGGAIASATFDDETSPNFARCLSAALTKLKLEKAPTDTTLEYSLSLIPAAAVREPVSIGQLLQVHQDKINACGTKSSFTGSVELTLSVRDDGSVAKLATPKGTGTLLTGCLTALFKTLDLGPSQAASTITYTLAIPFGQLPRDKAAVDSALAAKSEAVAACAKAAKDHPASVSMTLTVRAEGSVASALFAEGTPADLVACLSPIFTSLALPRGSTALELPYTLGL